MFQRQKRPLVIKNFNYLSLLVYNNHAARVVKLVDALDSKSSGSDTVPVRFRPRAPKNVVLAGVVKLVSRQHGE